MSLSEPAFSLSLPYCWIWTPTVFTSRLYYKDVYHIMYTYLYLVYHCMYFTTQFCAPMSAKGCNHKHFAFTHVRVT